MTGTGWGFQQRGEENQACAVGLLLLRLPWSQEKLRVLRTMGESSHLLRWPWQTPSKLCCPDRLHLQAGQVPLDPKQACPSRLKPESSKNSHLVFWKGQNSFHWNKSKHSHQRDHWVFLFINDLWAAQTLFDFLSVSGHFFLHPRSFNSARIKLFWPSC